MNWTGDGNPAWELWERGEWLAVIRRRPSHAPDGFEACFRRGSVIRETAAGALSAVIRVLGHPVPSLPDGTAPLSEPEPQRHAPERR